MGALAPVLGGIVPAIGATGFAAAATATGSVTGSLAVAASFGGAKVILFLIFCVNYILNFFLEDFGFSSVQLVLSELCLPLCCQKCKLGIGTLYTQPLRLSVILFL